MVICPDCGKESSGEKFCKNCGAYLANIVTVESQSPDLIEENVSSNQVSNEKFCHNCGAKLSSNYKFCPECGQNLSSAVIKTETAQVSSKEKSTLLAVILSVLLPGLGQIYLGLDNKGAILLIGYVISVILILLIIGLVSGFIIWIWALVDTIISANALNRGEEVKDKLL